MDFEGQFLFWAQKNKFIVEKWSPNMYWIFESFIDLNHKQMFWQSNSWPWQMELRNYWFQGCIYWFVIVRCCAIIYLPFRGNCVQITLTLVNYCRCFYLKNQFKLTASLLLIVLLIGNKFNNFWKRIMKINKLVPSYPKLR